MSSRVAALKLTLCRAVLIGALPTACAVGVTQEGPGDTSDPIDTAGSSTGGMSGASGSTSALPKAGTTSSAAGTPAVNPFGGSASTAGSGSGGQSSAGAAGSGGKAGSSSVGGTAGSSAGGRGGTTSGGTTSGGTTSGGTTSGGTSGAGTSGAGGTGSPGCACMMAKMWTDDTNLALGPGDCVDVEGAIYLYTGTKAQTWAQAACNPTMQATWCSGADYKFMLCR
jgi:hypothetical protein